MVRTKADGATRVAAGGKAPKKSQGRSQSSSSPSSGDKGKDNLPGNRYFPRETPSWQKKITFFYDKDAATSTSDKQSDNDQSNKSSKTNDSIKNDDDDMEAMDTD